MSEEDIQVVAELIARRSYLGPEEGAQFFLGGIHCCLEVLNAHGVIRDWKLLKIFTETVLAEQGINKETVQ